MITSSNSDLLLKEMENEISKKKKSENMLNENSINRKKITLLKTFKDFLKNINTKNSVNNNYNVKSMIISSKKGRIQ